MQWQAVGKIVSNLTSAGIKPEALLRMVAPGAGFYSGTLFRTKNR